MTQTPTNLLGLDRDGLRAWFEAQGERPFRADQMLKWVHARGVDNFQNMTDLARPLRERLEATAVVQAPEVIQDSVAHDGTRKWLLRLHDGNAIETVFIPEARRGTLCISSQVGCVLNCSFCSTGHQGFNRNLTTAEIIGQLWVAHRALDVRPVSERAITNVVMMGMGEPLLNFDAVVPAMRLMLDDNAYGLSRRRVTLSTAGMVPGMDELRTTLPVSLAVSLHATNDALRCELVPLNRKYPISELLAACKRYVEGDGSRRITFEYVMLKDINDSLDEARALAKLLRNIPAKINLIPFNPFPGTQYERSSQSRINDFRDVLIRAGYTTVTRRTRGDDIDAACGQLAGQVKDRTRRSLRVAPPTMELRHAGTP